MLGLQVTPQVWTTSVNCKLKTHVHQIKCSAQTFECARLADAQHRWKTLEGRDRL